MGPAGGNKESQAILDLVPQERPFCLWDPITRRRLSNGFAIISSRHELSATYNKSLHEMRKITRLRLVFSARFTEELIDTDRSRARLLVMRIHETFIKHMRQ